LWHRTQTGQWIHTIGTRTRVIVALQRMCDSGMVCVCVYGFGWRLDGIVPNGTGENGPLIETVCLVENKVLWCLLFRWGRAAAVHVKPALWLFQTLILVMYEWKLMMYIRLVYIKTLVEQIWTHHVTPPPLYKYLVVSVIRWTTSDNRHFYSWNMLFVWLDSVCNSPSYKTCYSK
jgi:hypothetical protein